MKFYLIILSRLIINNLKKNITWIQCLLTSPYMKRSVQQDAIVSDYTRAKFKNLAFFIDTQKPLVKLMIAMFYIHCWQ